MPLLESAADVASRVLTHLRARIRAAAVWNEPFSHTYFEDIFPAGIYAALLAHLPAAEAYWTGPHDPHAPPPVRTFYNLTTSAVRRFPSEARALWSGVAAALTDPELKRCLYAKLAPDLIRRYGVTEARVPDLPGYPRPTLYREVAGYELPAHPDTLKKVVTLHLYLPADLSQVQLGTALYQRKPGPLTQDDWRTNFTLVKQFPFRPNSGYAFVVNDSATRQSWHGREAIPPGCGVRNTLLNTFYADPRPGYSGYLEEEAPPLRIRAVP